MKYKIQEVNFELPFNNKGDKLLFTNSHSLRKGFDYDDVEISIMCAQKKYLLAFGGFAFDYASDFFKSVSKIEISEVEKLLFKSNKKVIIVDSDYLYRYVVVGQKQFALILYKYASFIYAQVVKVKSFIRKNEVLCKVKLLYSTIVENTLYERWKDIIEREFLPRLELERFLIQNGEIRERYKNLEEIDVTL